ncbi:MAG TPA: hypothetical protein VNE41_10430 [Chitinophagaceae bacterium]|nr:hypothetical protein [Chitinophagaceae bacterium]
MEPNSYRIGRRGIWPGVLVLLIGLGILAERMAVNMGYIFPFWFFHWPMLLIVIGFLMGIASRFRNLSWAVMVLIGGVFLAPEILPGMHISHYIWPVAIILIGLLMISGHRRERHYWWNWKYHQGYVPADQPQRPDGATTEDFIDSTSIFGGIRKSVFSKNFTGGDMTNIFGESRIDLSQADIQGIAVLDLTQVCGQTILKLPSLWEVRSEVVALFGGIEDRRNPQSIQINPGKVLILKGTTVCGTIIFSS